MYRMAFRTLCKWY